MLADLADDTDILRSGEDLFSRIYALKKILRKKDSDELKVKLHRLVKKTKIDIYKIIYYLLAGKIHLKE